MSTFSLIVEDTFYIEDKTSSGSYWENGIFYKGTETITYTEFQGIVDAYSKGETSLVVPEGTSNEEALILYTDETLKTHQSLSQGSNLADIIYLTNPDTDSSAVPYTVWDQAKYSKNQGFTLIQGNSPEYLLVRENRT